MTTKVSVLLPLFLLFVSLTVTAKRFPPYVDVCHQNDPNIKTCLIEDVEMIKKHFSTGIPEFGFPTLSPLVVPEVTLDNDNSFKASFKNLNIFYLEEMKVKDIFFDLDENTFNIKMNFPRLRMTSSYYIQGKILFLQLNGNGPADTNLTNIEADAKLQAQRYKKGTKEYLKFFAMEITEKFENAVIRFEGLFRNNPELTDQTNKIVNENINEIMDELRPSIHAAISQTVLGLISRLFDRFSIQELFPE